jgi:hypothetical protein
MTNLSPAAQAVLDAAINVAESPDAEAIAAAVLRALAFNVYSDEIVTCGGSSYALVIERDDILAIADELEDVKYGTYRSDLSDRPQ